MKKLNAAFALIFLLIISPIMSVAQVVINPGGGGSTTIVSGTTPITGGTDTRVLFDDAGTVGEDAGLTYNKTTDALTVVGLITANAGVDCNINSTTACLFKNSVGGGSLLFSSASIAKLAPSSAVGSIDFAGATLQGTTNQYSATFSSSTWLGLAGKVKIGGADAASPAARELHIGDSSRSGTDTDVAGGAGDIFAGRGTGSGAGGRLTLNRWNTKATGTTAQTSSPGILLCPTKILSNTTGTTQTVATITTTSTTGGQATVKYTVVANNGTLQNVDGGTVEVAWGNNAGTVTSTMSAVYGQADADASGTLAATPTRTDATNVVSIKLAPAWVTIVPTTVTAWLTFTLATSGDTITCG